MRTTARNSRQMSAIYRAESFFNGTTKTGSTGESQREISLHSTGFRDRLRQFSTLGPEPASFAKKSRDRGQRGVLVRRGRGQGPDRRLQVSCEPVRRILCSSGRRFPV